MCVREITLYIFLVKGDPKIARTPKESKMPSVLVYTLLMGNLFQYHAKSLIKSLYV